MSINLREDIRIIAISGRIASGSTTLAKQLAEKLQWKHIEGGDIFWEAVRNKMNLSSKDTHLRPDEEDVLFDEKLKNIIKNEKNIVLETKLAGFNAQGVDGIFKILVVCEDEDGNDQTQIRIDRLVNREGIPISKAKEEVVQREENDLEKWQRLYADGNKNWSYLNKNYYNLVVNTFSHNKDEALKQVLEAISSS